MQNADISFPQAAGLAPQKGVAQNEHARGCWHVAGASPVAEISPVAAWGLVEQGDATLLDVRTIEERSYVGRVPGSLHVAWATGTAMTRNPHFARQVQALLPDKSTLLLVLCRSGKRSAAAAEALTRAGYTQALSIAEGFEGEIDAAGHRGRGDGLPWQQD